MEIGWYEKHFNPYITDDSFINPNLDTCPEIARKLIVELQSNVTYILVVATYMFLATGNFSVISFGPNRIIFNKLRKCDVLVCCK